MSTVREPIPWPGLPETERRVLLELLLHGAQSRVRIAERIGLSRASLTRVARGLLDAGFVVEGELESKVGRGRPGESLRLVPEAAHFVGVKLTGDTCYVVLTDLVAEVLVTTERRLDGRDPAEVVDLIRQLVLQVTGDLPVVGLGVALAGDVVGRGGDSRVVRSPFLGWDDVPLRSLLESATGLRTSIANDVHALTVAQHWFGGFSGHRSLVVIGLGAGIGGGVVVEGELVSGAHGRAGRVGHTRLGGSGRACSHGHHDCIHSFVSIPAIEQNSGVAPGDYSVAVELARSGSARELAAFRDAARALGATVADMVNTLDPEVVVVLGEGRELLELAPAALREGIAEYLEQGDPKAVRLETPPFDFSQYAQGAAIVALQEALV